MSDATVRDIDVRQNTLRVEMKDGREVQYDPKRLRGVSVYERSERNFSTGDRIQLTAPDRSSGLANRETGKIERIDDSGNIHIRSDSGRTARITALLDRLLHHAHVLKCGPKSWRTKVHTDLRTTEVSA